VWPGVCRPATSCAGPSPSSRYEACQPERTPARRGTATIKKLLLNRAPRFTPGDDVFFNYFKSTLFSVSGAKLSRLRVNSEPVLLNQWQALGQARRAAREEIERLIDWLDSTIDVDEDFAVDDAPCDGEGDEEPSLGSIERNCSRYGSGRDRTGDQSAWGASAREDFEEEHDGRGRGRRTVPLRHRSVLGPRRPGSGGRPFRR
jgi:hypothetical protein